jgi:transaldolase
MTQKEIPAAEVRSQLETSYEDSLGIPEDVLRALGKERIARLYRVEPELIQFMTELRSSKDYQNLNDGDQLYKRFDRAGFGDLFYAPTAAEWQELRKGKLPDFSSALTKRLPIDTLYTLLADADFEKYQEDMDRQIQVRAR